MDLQRRQRRTILSGCLLVLTLICCVLPVKSISSRRHLVCIYRSPRYQSIREYQIENIPMDFCTHVLYEGIKSYSPWEDQTDMLKIEYQKFADIKNRQPDVKLLMDVICLPCLFHGGIESNDTRKLFIERVIRFLKQYNLDGLSYESWYPLELIEETKQAFKSAGHDTWTVSVHVSAIGNDTVHQQRICGVADFFILRVDRYLTYKINMKTRIQLYRRRSETSDHQRNNIMDGTQNWINSGCPRDLILLRVVFRGEKFELDDPSDHGVNTVTVRREYPKIMVYNEVCSMLQEAGWTVDWDEQSKAPFAYRGKAWIGYEDEVSLEEKANFVDSEGLGGLVVDSIDQDDYKGVCGKKYPLLTALWKTYKPTWSTDDDPFTFAIFRTTKRPSRRIRF